MDELDLLADADARGLHYIEANATRRVFPSDEAIAALRAFDEPLPARGLPAEDTLALLDDIGSPATTASNGPRYFGFVIGAALPAAAAAERLMLAWDQCASTFDNSPVAATLERIAGSWVLDALDLPRDSAVGFGTSATACTLVAIVAARRALLARKGWDFDNDGLIGAPEIRVVISGLAHITVRKDRGRSGLVPRCGRAGLRSGSVSRRGVRRMNMPTGWCSFLPACRHNKTPDFNLLPCVADIRCNSRLVGSPARPNPKPRRVGARLACLTGGSV